MSNFLTGLMVAGITVLTLINWEVQRFVVMFLYMTSDLP
jgi:hypothetical protein